MNLSDLKSKCYKCGGDLTNNHTCYDWKTAMVEKLESDKVTGKITKNREGRTINKTCYNNHPAITYQSYLYDDMGCPLCDALGKLKYYHNHWLIRHSKEISLRDYFAGKALMGVLNNGESRIVPMRHQKDISNAEILAENCYYMADAMLKKRELERE